MWRKPWKLKEEALCTKIWQQLRESESCDHSMLKVGVYNRTPISINGTEAMEMLQHDQFVVRIDRLAWRNRRFLRLYNPMSTSIDTKAFHGSCKNLPSPHGGNVNHECPDSLDDVSEHSSVPILVNQWSGKRAHSHFYDPTKNNLPLALHRFRDFNVPGKLKDGMLCKKNGLK